MKLFTALFLFLIISITASSQVKKGQFLVGGSISFTANKSGSASSAYYKTSNFLTTSNIGYFIIDKLAAGARLNLASFHQKVGADNTTTTLTTLSPFVRYYFLPPSKMVNAFIDISYNTYKNKYSTSLSPISQTNRSYGYTITAGPSIFLNKHVALEFTVGYQANIPKGFPESKTTQFNTGLGLQIHLGKIKSKANV